jgi:hypothetical protein
MDLTQLANLGEFIGGVAVLVTLVYLALQVRQNTRALSTNRHQEMLAYLRDVWQPYIEQPEFTKLIRTCEATPAAVDEDEWNRFGMYAFEIFAMWEAAYISHRNGLLDDQFWNGWKGAGSLMWSGPGYRKFWNEYRDGHTPIFQDYIDSEIFPVEDHP